MAKKNILIKSKLKKAQGFIQSEQFEQARQLLESLYKTLRTDPELLFMLGVIYSRLNKPADSAKYFQQALRLQPGNVQLSCNLGAVLRDAGNLDNAAKVYQQALKIKPDIRDASMGLAHVLILLDRLDEAESVLRQALRYFPRDAEMHSNLGAVLQNQGLIEQAVDCFQQALSINPALPAYSNLASALSSLGEYSKALEAYRKGFANNPGNAANFSSMLLSLNYMPEIDPQHVFQEHQRWNQCYGSCPGAAKHPNINENGRVLRVGYVSADFRSHSVASFMEPILRAHDRRVVEVICYSDNPMPDQVTRRFQEFAEQWRDTYGLSPQAMVEQIKADRIDILVDLAGHTAHNRMTVFTKRPAPLQVTYLGYPNTTGQDAIDYRLTDSIADPEGADAFYTEKLHRLPDCFLCYEPPDNAPEISPALAISTGSVTFGSFNNLAKINDAVVELWAKVLQSVPGSRLLIKNPSLTERATQDRYRVKFAAHGINAERIELLGHTPTREAHLAMYSRVDIALDTFPYNGTTTTVEALYMGVPVITLTGESHRNRVGESLLRTLGYTEWVAETPQLFVDIAIDLSADIEQLADLGKTLRHCLLESPLCDAAMFTRKLEFAYRDMWKKIQKE